VLTNKYVRVMPCPTAPLEVPMTETGDRGKPDPGKAAAASRPARDSVRGSHDGRDGAGGIAARDFPAGREPGISRPSTAPAYYLGRPARLWITVMRPRRRRTTSGHPVQAVTGGGKQAHHGTAAGRKIRSPLIPARFSPAPHHAAGQGPVRDDLAGVVHRAVEPADVPIWTSRLD
jgi:hypothetical protein